MQIHAHSLVSVNPVPYLHLGYLSAATREITAMSAISLWGIYATLLLCVIGLLTTRRHPRIGLALGGAAAFGLVIALIAYLGSNTGLLHYSNPISATRGHLLTIGTCIAKDMEAGNPVPTHIAALRNSWNLTPNSTEDGWQRQPRIRQEHEGTLIFYTVTSAGADGRFDTSDDITICVDKEFGSILGTRAQFIDALSKRRTPTAP